MFAEFITAKLVLSAQFIFGSVTLFGTADDFHYIFRTVQRPCVGIVFRTFYVEPFIEQVVEYYACAILVIFRRLYTLIRKLDRKSVV